VTEEALLMLRFAPEGRSDPTVDAVLHLLYGLGVLYAESFDELPLNGHGSRWEKMWLYPSEEWVSMMRGIIPKRKKRRTMWPSSPDPREWPNRVPTPFVDERAALHLRSVVMASPLELVIAIPSGAVGALGVMGVVRFLKAIERTWHLPKRVRVEGARLDREYWEARLEGEKARDRYFHYYHEGFDLEEAQLDLSSAPQLMLPDEESSGE
jgi:hypothetical protein